VNRVPGPRRRDPGLHHRPVADALALGGAGAVLAVLLGAEQARALLPPSAHELLTLAAAGIGVGSAVLAVLASRLLDDRRTAWIAAALVLYSAVVLPWSTLESARGDGPHRGPVLVVYLAALLLLVLSVRPPRALGSWGGWAIALAGAALGVLALLLPPSAALHEAAVAFVPTVAVLVGWTAAAVASAAAGLRARSAPRLRLGMGLVVLAVAQLHRVATGAAPGQDLAFDGLRLLGLGVVAVALFQLVGEGLGRLQSRHWEQEEEIATAALHLERAREIAAERDHELRNGLASLAGITTLLGNRPDRELEPLRHAVLAELDRLLALVDAGGAGVPAPRAAAADADDAGYSVAQVLADRAALRTSAAVPGAGPLELRVEAGVRAAGSPDLLSQVLANLLANCDRHAPGAPITVSARRRGGSVVVRVRDRGPGLPPELAGSVLERGVRDDAGGGQGFGLAISARLVARAGGNLTVGNAPGAGGCLATVSLPAVTDSPPVRPIVDADRPSAVSSGSRDNLRGR
jgi:two-component system, OmpR family, sensor kinase